MGAEGASQRLAKLQALKQQRQGVSKLRDRTNQQGKAGEGAAGGRGRSSSLAGSSKPPGAGASSNPMELSSTGRHKHSPRNQDSASASASEIREMKGSDHRGHVPDVPTLHSGRTPAVQPMTQSPYPMSKQPPGKGVQTGKAKPATTSGAPATLTPEVLPDPPRRPSQIAEMIKRFRTAPPAPRDRRAASAPGELSGGPEEDRSGFWWRNQSSAQDETQDGQGSTAMHFVGNGCRGATEKDLSRSALSEELSEIEKIEQRAEDLIRLAKQRLLSDASVELADTSRPRPSMELQGLDASTHSESITSLEATSDWPGPSLRSEFSFSGAEKGLRNSEDAEEDILEAWRKRRRGHGHSTEAMAGGELSEGEAFFPPAEASSGRPQRSVEMEASGAVWEREVSVPPLAEPSGFQPPYETSTLTLGGYVRPPAPWDVPLSQKALQPGVIRSQASSTGGPAAVEQAELTGGQDGAEDRCHRLTEGEVQSVPGVSKFVSSSADGDAGKAPQVAESSRTEHLPVDDGGSNPSEPLDQNRRRDGAALAATEETIPRESPAPLGREAVGDHRAEAPSQPCTVPESERWSGDPPPHENMLKPASVQPEAEPGPTLIFRAEEHPVERLVRAQESQGMAEHSAAARPSNQAMIASAGHQGDCEPLGNQTCLRCKGDHRLEPFSSEAAASKQVQSSDDHQAQPCIPNSWEGKLSGAIAAEAGPEVVTRPGPSAEPGQDEVEGTALPWQSQTAAEPTSRRQAEGVEPGISQLSEEGTESAQDLEGTMRSAINLDHTAVISNTTDNLSQDDSGRELDRTVETVADTSLNVADDTTFDLDDRTSALRPRRRSGSSYPGTPRSELSEPVSESVLMELSVSTSAGEWRETLQRSQAKWSRSGTSSPLGLSVDRPLAEAASQEPEAALLLPADSLAPSDLPVLAGRRVSQHQFTDSRVNGGQVVEQQQTAADEDGPCLSDPIPDGDGSPTASAAVSPFEVGIRSQGRSSSQLNVPWESELTSVSIGSDRSFDKAFHPEMKGMMREAVDDVLFSWSPATSADGLPTRASLRGRATSEAASQHSGDMNAELIVNRGEVIRLAADAQPAEGPGRTKEQCATVPDVGPSHPPHLSEEISFGAQPTTMRSGVCQAPQAQAAPSEGPLVAEGWRLEDVADDSLDSEPAAQHSALVAHCEDSIDRGENHCLSDGQHVAAGSAVDALLDTGLTTPPVSILDTQQEDFILSIDDTVVVEAPAGSREDLEHLCSSSHTSMPDTEDLCAVASDTETHSPAGSEVYDRFSLLDRDSLIQMLPSREQSGRKPSPVGTSQPHEESSRPRLFGIDLNRPPPKASPPGDESHQPVDMVVLSQSVDSASQHGNVDTSRPCDADQALQVALGLPLPSEAAPSAVTSALDLSCCDRLISTEPLRDSCASCSTSGSSATGPLAPFQSLDPPGGVPDPSSNCLACTIKVPEHPAGTSLVSLDLDLQPLHNWTGRTRTVGQPLPQGVVCASEPPMPLASHQLTPSLLELQRQDAADTEFEDDEMVALLRRQVERCREGLRELGVRV